MTAPTPRLSTWTMSAAVRRWTQSCETLSSSRHQGRSSTTTTRESSSASLRTIPTFCTHRLLARRRGEGTSKQLYPGPNWEIGGRRSSPIPTLSRASHGPRSYGSAQRGDSREIDRLRRRRVDEDFLTLGQGLAGAFVKVAVCDRGVAVHTRSPALRLLQTDGRVIGAVADVGGQPTEIRARRGVLIATGAYGNAPYAAAWEGLPELHDAGPPVTDGDHLSLTEPTPAAQVRAGEAFVTLGFHLPGEVHADTNTQLYRQAITSLGFPHSMIVNAAGRRFGDESLHGRPPGLLDRDARTRHFTNYPCWLIVDDRFRRRYGLGPLPAGAAWPSGWASAGSIGQLASQAGIDKRGLAEAVSRLNRFAEAGVDEDFRRGSLLHVQRAYGDPAYANPNLGTVEDPPFWAIPLALIGVGIYSIGLKIDRLCRVLAEDQLPVPGLYATGNAVAYTEQPHYIGGFANARNIVYGHGAATHAASDERELDG